SKRNCKLMRLSAEVQPGVPALITSKRGESKVELRKSSSICGYVFVSSFSCRENVVDPPTQINAVDARHLLLRKLLSPESKTVDHVLRLLAVKIIVVVTCVGVQGVHQVWMRHIVGYHVRIVTASDPMNALIRRSCWPPYKT